LPPTHEEPPRQVVPQAPQFVALVARSTQAFAQLDSPAPHEAAQAAFAQT
jgi:hypothetical protein